MSGIFHFFIFAFFKPKLSLNRSKTADPFRFGLTMLYSSCLNILLGSIINWSVVSVEIPVFIHVNHWVILVHPRYKLNNCKKQTLHGRSQYTINNNVLQTSLLPKLRYYFWKCIVYSI